MCGIAGIVSTNLAEAEIRQALAAMLAAQTHRGPNDAGETVLPFGNGLLGLGHRRLSILDLSSAGHQPMSHPENGDWLIFNGEIYNHASLRDEMKAAGIRFVGHSDTEVLLHGLSRWGIQCLSRLEGMYALAFYNARDHVLTLARDPLGIKPLYLGRLADGFLFASEVRALLASRLIRPTLDQRGLASMLAYGSVQHPLTMFEGIHSFPPGCYQQFGAGGRAINTKPVPFWSIPKPQTNLQPEYALRQIRQTLQDSVRDHLVADVPVGVFLSSGLDSTVVAGLASKHSQRLSSFCVGFADQPEFSEFQAAAETARLFGLQHTEISISGYEAEAASQAWLKTLDQPSMDGLNTFVISEAVRKQGITVALSGLGGDELFGGYPSFADVPRLHRVLGPLRRLPSPLRSGIGALATFQRSAAVKDKLRDMLDTDGSLLSLYLQRRRCLSTALLKDLGLDHQSLGVGNHYLPAESLADISINDSQPVWTLSQLEMRFYQANTLLRDSDANSMAHSLEIRVPMLDLRLLNLMGTITDSVRLPSKSANKHLLREAFAPLLRPDLLKQNKRGFTLPLRRWMLGPMRESCEHVLAYLKTNSPLRSEGIDKVWNSFLADPESPIWSRAFSLVVLGHYLEQTDKDYGR